MQLEPSPRFAGARARLGAAACLLLASGLPAAAQPDAAPKWQLDATGLLYGEAGRVSVTEPTARITRLFPSGQSLSAQLTLDAITGASPSGALPTGRVQTTTTPSGRTSSSQVGAIPVSRFRDFRSALDLGWKRPFLRFFTFSTGTHASKEKDYQSLGLDGKLSVDLMQRLTTLTIGGGVNRDGVTPIGGTPVGLTDASGPRAPGTNSKDVTTTTAGISRVLTRRWMVAVNGTVMQERGYLTEPYKVLSVLKPGSGLIESQLTERRPSTRRRADLLASSVYHLDENVIYSSYRYYQDDWGIRSHTVDFKYRAELADNRYLEPHLRFYTQTPADFFHIGLIQGAPLPEFASDDYRLGALKTVTLGATYGFHPTDEQGEITVRGEYMLQWGNGHPSDAIGVQRSFDLFPALNIVSLVVGYTVQF